MNRVGSILVLFAALLGTRLAQPGVPDQAVRFLAVDVFVDSKGAPLAAYQVEFSTKTGNARVVGVEGGEHPAFNDAPFYDPKAIQQERVIIAAFNTAAGNKLPKGKTRVATIHLQVGGEPRPQYVLTLQVAAAVGGEKIHAEASFEERNPK